MSNVVNLNLWSGRVGPQRVLQAERVVIERAEGFANALAAADEDICEYHANVAAAERRLVLAVRRLQKAREGRTP